MQIKRVQIDDFGQWQNKRFDFEPGLQVIAGLNGSGKTTLHRFILGMLFGFPKAKGRYVNTYERAQTNRYGGKLWFSHGKNQYELSRHGRTKSKVTLVNMATQQAVAEPEQTLLSFFEPLTADFYQAVYDFDQESLLAVFQLTPAKFLASMRTVGLPQAEAWLALAKEWDKEAQADFGLTQQARRPLNQALQQLKASKQSLENLVAQRPALAALDQTIHRDHAALTKANQEQQSAQAAKQVAPLEAELDALTAWIAQQPAVMDEQLVVTVQQEQAQLAYLKQMQAQSHVNPDLEKRLRDWQVATSTGEEKTIPSWAGYGLAVFIASLGLIAHQLGWGLLLAALIAGLTWFKAADPLLGNSTKPTRGQSVNWVQDLKALGFDAQGLTPSEALARYAQVKQEQLRLREQIVSTQATLLKDYQKLGLVDAEGFTQRLQSDQAVGRAKTRIELLQTQITALRQAQTGPAVQQATLSADELTALQTRLARAELQKKTYLADNQLQALRQDIVTQQSQLAAGLLDYFTNRLAAKWIRMSLDQANEDRWPQLMDRTNALLTTLTQGQLVSLIWQEKTFQAIDQQGQRLSLVELSRATAEQVYLALRLALIEQEPSTVPLPILIDDAFVDFDAPRQASLIAILQALAQQGNQVLYFTKAAPKGQPTIELTD